VAFGTCSTNAVREAPVATVGADNRKMIMVYHLKEPKKKREEIKKQIKEAADKGKPWADVDIRMREFAQEEAEEAEAIEFVGKRDRILQGTATEAERIEYYGEQERRLKDALEEQKKSKSKKP
jgi:head-tail adaptor